MHKRLLSSHDYPKFMEPWRRLRAFQFLCLSHHNEWIFADGVDLLPLGRFSRKIPNQIAVLSIPGLPETA